MDDDSLEQLKSLHTNAVDARHGYEEALDDAGGHGLTALFREMMALHRTHANELSAYLVGHGARVNDDGSFMSLIHRTIMSIRALFDGLGASVLPGLIDGETRNKASYETALEMHTLPEDARRLLTRQRDRIEAALAGMKSQQR